jgi:hypothetical protein
MQQRIWSRSKNKIPSSQEQTVDSGFWLAEDFEQALTIASNHAPVCTIQQHAAAQLIARKVYGWPQAAAQRPELVHLILGQLEADSHRALLHDAGKTLAKCVQKGARRF